ncbi:hypothetical protein BKP30_28520 [Rhodococcus erythropolis]|nr:hypothetical protein BKP30_28520 [Rhodococcus erythropolis]
MGSILSGYSAAQSRLRIDGNDHAGVAVRERTITDVTEGVKNFEIGTITPYFAFTLLRISSNSGPPLTKRAVPATSKEPSATFPLLLHGTTVTRGLFRSRLALPDFEEVQNPIRPSGNWRMPPQTPRPCTRMNFLCLTRFETDNYPDEDEQQVPSDGNVAERPRLRSICGPQVLEHDFS